MNLVVIKNKHKKRDLNEDMYRFIELNSIFNIIYCSIIMLKLINTCVFDQAGIFCSSLYEANASQYFKLVVIHFLGNALKLSSNVSYLMFAFSRMILIRFQRKNVKRNEKHTQNRIRIFIHFLLILFSSCLLSSFKLFQYKLNEEKNAQKSFPYEKRDELYCDSIDVSIECKLFNSFKLFNSLLNDILFVLVNILIDILLLRNFHLHLNEKTRHLFLNDSTLHRNIQQSKKRVNRMIFCNSLAYICSHLPECVVTIWLVVDANRVLSFCQNKISCEMMSEEAEFFCLISIVCQFYIFLMFDKNFKSSFGDVKKRCMSFCWYESEKMNNGKAKNQSSFQLTRTAISTIELKNVNNLIGNGLID